MDTTTQLYDLWKKSTGVSTDTRTLKKGNIFFALSGDNFNGNEYAEKALQTGASHAVVSDPKVALNNKYILVNDTLEALQLLARHHRNSLDIPFIALTGSNGKTTTKELISVVLSTKYNTLATPGNYNNHIGVPLTILSVKPEHELAIVEMGANHLGEISDLCAIADPSHGLITNIGKAHIGTFGGVENILRGKSELFDYLIKKNAVIWVNKDDEKLRNMSNRMIKPLLYPGEYYDASYVSADPFLILRDEHGKKVRTQLVGKYNYQNVVAALAVGKFFGVDPKIVKGAIESYSPANNRSQVLELNSNTVILDAYNANPTSMKAALDNFLTMKSKKNKWVILGDMLELGEDEEEEHRKIGDLLMDRDISAIYVGKLMENAYKAHEGSKFFPETEALLDKLPEMNIHQALMLVKGSRAMKLERITEVLQ